MNEEKFLIEDGILVSYLANESHVVIPEGVITIRNDAFENADNMVSIVLPTTLKEIESSAFLFNEILVIYNLSFLDIVLESDGYGRIASNAKTIKNTVDKDGCIYIIDDFKFIFDGLDYYLIEYTGNDIRINLPESINGSDYIISQRMHKYTKYWISLTIPKGVKHIEEYAFISAKKLVELYNFSSIDIKKNKLDDDEIGRYVKVIHTKDVESSIIETTDGFQFIEEDGKYYLFNYLGDSKEITLPPNIKGKPYSINSYLFEFNDELTSVTMTTGVKSIGISAFDCCSKLAKVILSDDLEFIGHRAFAFCLKLKTITIPKKVKDIIKDAFDYSYNLIEVFNLSDLNIKTGYSSHGKIGLYAKFIHKSLEEKCEYITTTDGFVFAGKDKLYYLIDYLGDKKNLILPTDVNGEKYIINDYAFYHKCDFDSIFISEGVIKIGSKVFCRCHRLREVFISKSVKHIESNAFLKCTQLEKIIVDKDNRYYDSRDNCNCLIDSSTNRILAGSKNSTIPYGVTFIDKKIFTDLQINELVIPSSVTLISEKAFMYCEDLKKVVIEEGIKELNYLTFAYCTNLEEITIPKTLKKIEMDVFFACNNLKKVYYNGSKEEWDELDINIGNEILKEATIYFVVV